jgi:hypothetical protein
MRLSRSRRLSPSSLARESSIAVHDFAARLAVTAEPRPRRHDRMGFQRLPSLASRSGWTGGSAPAVRQDDDLAFGRRLGGKQWTLIRQSPRTVSKYFVSSRAIAASRGPRLAAKSFNISATRRGTREYRGPESPKVQRCGNASRRFLRQKSFKEPSVGSPRPPGGERGRAPGTETT